MVTDYGPAKIRFLHISKPTPDKSRINTFVFVNFSIVSKPYAPIYQDYKLWSISFYYVFSFYIIKNKINKKI